VVLIPWIVIRFTSSRHIEVAKHWRLVWGGFALPGAGFRPDGLPDRHPAPRAGAITAAADP